MPVVDTSIIVALILDEPNASAIEQWLATTTDLHAPDILPVEVANALINAQRRGRLNEAGVRLAFAELADIPIVLHPGKSLLPRALDLCLAYQRRPYDALFVALAERLEQPLITGDLALVRGLVGTPVERWVKAMSP
jgi:predicted nucleic acid-binding protein